MVSSMITALSGNMEKKTKNWRKRKRKKNGDLSYTGEKNNYLFNMSHFVFMKENLSHMFGST